MIWRTVLAILAVWGAINVMFVVALVLRPVRKPIRRARPQLYVVRTQ